MTDVAGTRRSRTRTSTDSRKRAGRQLSVELEPSLMQDLDLAVVFSALGKGQIVSWAISDWIENYTPKPDEDPEPAVTRLALERVRRDKNAMKALERMARSARDDDPDEHDTKTKTPRANVNTK